MPKPVCVRCEIEFRVRRVGVAVIEMAYEPPIPYRITQADLLRCPQCGQEIVTGFAQKSIEHHEGKFKEALEKALAGSHLHCYEWRGEKAQ